MAADYLQKGFAAASIGLRATFNSNGDHLDTTTTSIDGNTIDHSMNGSAHDVGFDPNRLG